MKNYMRLLAYIKPYTRRLALAVVCIIMAAGANLYLPWIIKDMIDDVLMSKDMVMLNLIAAGILVVMFTRGVFYYGQSYLVSYVGQRVIIDVRSVLFRKFQRMPLSYYDKQQTGTVMSYITNDVAVQYRHSGAGGRDYLSVTGKHFCYSSGKVLCAGILRD